MTTTNQTNDGQTNAIECNPKAKADPFLSTNKSTLLAALRDVGATRAVIAYSGHGDSGNANEVSVTSSDEKPIAASELVGVIEPTAKFKGGRWVTGTQRVRLTLEDALSGYADRAIEVLHPGFENGEGGEGEITFHVACGTIEMEHRDFYLESDVTYSTL